MIFSGTFYQSNKNVKYFFREAHWDYPNNNLSVDLQ